MPSLGACGQTDAVVARAIAGYAPRSVSVRAAGFAREVVAAAAPRTPARAKALLFAAGRLAAFADRVGLELDEGLLCEAVIERFVLVGCAGVSAATRRTLRTNLRSLARAVERYPQPTPVPLARERAKRSYTEAQIEGYLRLAGALSSERRRMRASALVCLGAGAGIVAGELRHLRGSDVLERAGGVLVTVSGRRARSVPVLDHYRQPLLGAASFAGERLIAGGPGGGAAQRHRRALCAAVDRQLAAPPGARTAQIHLACSVRPPDRAWGVHAGGRHPLQPAAGGPLRPTP